MKELDAFTNLLISVIECAEKEKEKICNHVDSEWNYDQIEKVVMPEMNELLSYANQGKLFFKYGKKQQLLESTYIITDSIKNLANTILGEKVIELQEVYNRF